jgi:hypothetical protein
MVTGAPVTRSPLMILVPPSRAHSARIVRIGAFCADRLTRPSRNSIFTDCAAAGSANTVSRAASGRTRNFMMTIQYTARESTGMSV